MSSNVNLTNINYTFIYGQLNFLHSVRFLEKSNFFHPKTSKKWTQFSYFDPIYITDSNRVKTPKNVNCIHANGLNGSSNKTHHPTNWFIPHQLLKSLPSRKPPPPASTFLFNVYCGPIYKQISSQIWGRIDVQNSLGLTLREQQRVPDYKVFKRSRAAFNAFIGLLASNNLEL